MNLDDLDEAVEKTDIFLDPSDPTYRAESATPSYAYDTSVNDEAIARELAAQEEAKQLEDEATKFMDSELGNERVFYLVKARELKSTE